MSKGFVFRKIECLITNAGVAAKGGVRPVEADLGLFEAFHEAIDSS